MSCIGHSRWCAAPTSRQVVGQWGRAVGLTLVGRHRAPQVANGEVPQLVQAVVRSRSRPVSRPLSFLVSIGFVLPLACTGRDKSAAGAAGLATVFDTTAEHEVKRFVLGDRVRPVRAGEVAGD
jgi:hypothetical protein